MRKNPAPTDRLLPILLTCVLPACLATSVANAATVTVGNGGCNYIGLQFALDELESQPGPHTLKLKTQTIAIPAGLVLDTATTSYTFIGGHASCSDSTPTPGQRTVLDAGGGANGTAMAINGTSASSTPAVNLRNLSIRGGSAETGPFANPEGGGLEIRGRVSVRLDANVNIENNASGKGGGVYLRGDNASERAELWILGGSYIAENSASTLGGGIYCDGNATVFHDSGDISLNTAQQGGGAYLQSTCVYDGVLATDAFTGFNQNTASQSGGGLYSRGNVELTGSNSTPFWFLGNRAGVDGGGLLLSGAASATLRTTVFMSNGPNGSNRAGSAIAVYQGGALQMRPAAGHHQCSFLGVGLGGCSAIVGNTSWSAALGGVVTAMGAVGEPATVTLRDTVVLDNTGPAILDAWYHAGFDVVGSVLRGNTVFGTTEQAALLRLRNDDGTQAAPSRLGWSTVVGNIAGAAGAAVLDQDGAALNLRGSILHNPGMVVRSSGSSGSVSHSGCLLVHDIAGLPGGGNAPIVASPGLSSDLTPALGSAALDVCASSGVPVADLRGNSRVVDQVGEANVYGPVDLGAIERPADPPPATPQLRVYWAGALIPDGTTSTTTTNFGSLGVEQGSVFRDFVVRNEGDAHLAISGHSVSGPCSHNFAVSVIAPGVAPGGQGVARVVFDPVESGTCFADYQIISNDPGSPYTFRVRGTGLGVALFADGFEGG